VHASTTDWSQDMTTAASPDVLDNATLVARARDGDVSAFEVIVRRYRASMYALAVRMLADRAEAEDVVQEVFIAGWRWLPEIRANAAFSTWLYRSTTNRCLNRLRTRDRTRPLDDREVIVAVRSDQPEDAAEVHAEIDALLRALGRLTAEQRACWLLRDVHALSYEEIAHILHTTTTAVRGRIARARAQLAEEMESWR
jgi:RNA polymerase sigma-70 factor, ECF subfamily